MPKQAQKVDTSWLDVVKKLPSQVPPAAAPPIAPPAPAPSPAAPAHGDASKPLPQRKRKIRGRQKEKDAVERRPSKAMWGASRAIEIDGKTLEGGGQILRLAVSLAAVHRREVVVHSIRGNRPKPGLARQHLAGLCAVAEITGAEMEGLEIGSQKVRFVPSGNTCIQSGQYSADCGTAGSIALVMQVLMPLMVIASPNLTATTSSSTSTSTSISISGGTRVKFAPTTDFYSFVLLPLLNHCFGIRARLAVKAEGYYPRGGGVVELVVESRLPDKKRKQLQSKCNLVVQGQMQQVMAKVYVHTDAYSEAEAALAKAEGETAAEGILRDVCSHLVPRRRFPQGSAPAVRLLFGKSVSSAVVSAGKRARAASRVTIGMQMAGVTSTGCRLSSNEHREGNCEVSREAQSSNAATTSATAATMAKLVEGFSAEIVRKVVVGVCITLQV